MVREVVVGGSGGKGASCGGRGWSGDVEDRIRGRDGSVGGGSV